MANGKNTMEYGKILHISPKLCDVVADGNVITLSRKMFEAGLISDSNAGKTLRNVMVDSKMRRAAELVQMITTKVELNSENFHKFLEVLEKDQDTYKDIIQELMKGSMCLYHFHV